MSRRFSAILLTAALLWLAGIARPARAVILWSEPGARLVHETGTGVDILGGAVKRTRTNGDALYFKFHVDPLSDVASEHYFAGLQLFEGDEEHLGVGNAMEAWGYSAFMTSETGPSNNAAGEFNLRSAHPEPWVFGQFRPYELVRQGVEHTIIFKVQFVPDNDAVVTVWLDPNLGHGDTDKNQPENLTTKFKAKAVFNQIRLRHGRGDPDNPKSGGNGWIFSDLAIATSFDDFVVVRFWQSWWFILAMTFTTLLAVVAMVRLVETRKFRRRLQRIEQETALERERGRIARDLHDELGSSLTRLSLLSGLIKTDRDNPKQVELHAGRIAQAADQSVRALEEIVWAVRPGSDTLQSLVDYIAHFANELFEGNPSRCRLDLPKELPAQPVPPDVRHNIFLIIKEALTNALKHAGAAEVRVVMTVAAHTLEIQVQDNGRGFDPAAPGEGLRNGLGNMRRRAEVIGSRLELQSAPNSGTTVRLLLNLKNGTNAGQA